jgi:AcrR family transcriptional regulator
MAQSAPARLHVDERRRRLLALGSELFTHTDYGELSMSKIARAAGISKALLYHYFPSKQAYFAATLQQAATELAAAVEPDAALQPVEQLTHSLDAYLEWVDVNAESYATLMRSVGAVPEVRELIDRVRRTTADRIVDGLAGDEPATAAMRAAVRGWLGFTDGVLEDWLEHRDLDRGAVRSLLLGTLLGAVAAAGRPVTG